MKYQLIYANIIIIVHVHTIYKMALCMCQIQVNLIIFHQLDVMIRDCIWHFEKLINFEDK